MKDQKLFIKNSGTIFSLDFNLIDSYVIKLSTNGEIVLLVKLRNSIVETYNIKNIATRIGSMLVNQSSGIYYEIKNICTELVKDANIKLPEWMTTQSTY